MSDEIRATFMRNLRNLSDRAVLSQTDIAKQLGVSSSTVSDWFNGHKIPRMDKIQQLADLFGCELSDLLEDKPEPSFLDPDRRYLLDQLHTMTDDQVKQLSALWDIIDKQTRDQ